eukprot:gb/GFBE01014199.1/.p1 GENE.gb/GFBE01014199.1/~~gb/GFBE01014199.1/.p1  ORF type:complete len:621 (+),score=123.38 gb/GFBE01014199.1/:1-1863(+)
MSHQGLRKVFGEITNTVSGGPKEAWADDEAAPPATPKPAAPRPAELEVVGSCAVELHQLWLAFANGGDPACNYLRQHFAALGALLQPPAAAPPAPSEEALLAAERAQEGSPQHQQWSEVMRGIAADSADDADRSAQRPSPAPVAAPERSHARQQWPAASRGSDEEPLERRLCFEQALDSSLEESRVMLEGEEDEEAEEDREEEASVEGSISDIEDDHELVPPSWRQKELCEAELENRLAELLLTDQPSEGEEAYGDDDCQLAWEGDSAASGGSCASWPSPAAPAPEKLEGEPLVTATDSNASTILPLPAARWVFRTPVRRHKRSANAGLGGAKPFLTGVPRQDAGRSCEAEKTSEVDAALAGMTASLLQVYHRESERYRTNSQAVLARFGAAERVLAVDWLLQSCRAMGFAEVVAFAAQLCLDRYCATLPTTLPTEQMQVLFLSVVSIALKLHGSSNQFPAPLRDVLAHLGQYRIPAEMIFDQERKVLIALDFQVSAPTAHELLDLISVSGDDVPGDEADACGKCCGCTNPLVWQLAAFLLRLALRDVGLLYRYPQAVLAVSAAWAALWSIQADAQPCMAKQSMLLRRLHLACVKPRVGTSSVRQGASSSASGSRQFYCI